MPSSQVPPRRVPGARRPIVLLVLGALAGAGFAAAGLTASGTGRALSPGVVALVNGQPIRDEDYTRMLAAVAGDRRAPLGADDRRHVLDRLIDEELLVQRGLDLGLAGTDRRVRGDLIATVVAGIVGDADAREATDEELDAFFAANRDFFAGPGRLRLRQVFVRVAAPADDAAVRARAADAARRLRAGEDVAVVAAELGDAPLSPLPDALLPPAKLRDYLGPTALRAALDLTPGAVSDPVRSGAGYHVLHAVEREADTTPALADVRPQVAAEYRRRAGDAALRAYLDDLRDRSDVVAAEPPP